MKGIFFIFLSLIVFSGCVTIYNPATQRSELVFVTTPMEMALGQRVALQVAREFKISHEIKFNERVREIGQKVATHSDRKDIRYSFFVVEDSQVNAFSIPGGYVYVHTGLLEKATDDELACVLGHEIGHVAARHIAKKLQAQLGYDILMNIALREANIQDFQKAIDITFNLVSLGYSREDEILADRLGVRYANKAGYDPWAMISFLKKLKEIEGEDPSLIFIFLRSHPAITQRIKILENAIPSIKAGTDIQKAPQVTPIYSDNKLFSYGPKFCSKCGRQYSRDKNFCPRDGTKLEWRTYESIFRHRN